MMSSTARLFCLALRQHAMFETALGVPDDIDRVDQEVWWQQQL